MDILDGNRLKQYLLLGFIIGLALLLATQLYEFFPGLLGAVTLYILLRQWYFKMTIIKNWKKGLTAALFILGSMLVFVLPICLLGAMVMPKLMQLVGNANQFSAGIDHINAKLQTISPQLVINRSEIQALVQRITASAPAFLGATFTILTNLILCYFLLYFMLVEGRKMERRIQDFLPLKDENIDDIWVATRVMVVSNAIGIPMLAAIQAISATIGYYIFGIHDYVLWGVLTGVFSLLPVIGTTAIWAPLCIYLMASGKVAQGTGLLLFSLLFTVNIDNVLRFTLLKKLGDVHPVITVLGIIVGVPLFGFMGFIFGPLLISYVLLLIRIYQVEFSPRRQGVHSKPVG